MTTTQSPLMIQEIQTIRRALEMYAERTLNKEEIKEAERLGWLFKDAVQIVVETAE